MVRSFPEPEIASRQTVEKELGVQPNMVEKSRSSVTGASGAGGTLVTYEDPESGANGAVRRGGGGKGRARTRVF